ncbi:MAG: ABC transporter ATP-binding protein [Candidatus Nomurabacteria bacterium]|nr:MAG: ABC transporter ATP-binding protein [Candidatus Nomurabacteria bacterium]
MSTLKNEIITDSVSNRESLAYIWMLFNKYPLGWFFVMIGVFMSRAGLIGVMYAFKLAIDAAVIGDEQGMIFWFISCGFIYIGFHVGNRIRDYAGERTEDRTKYLAEKEAMEILVSKDASFYENRFTGTLSRSVNGLGGLFANINSQIIWNILPFVFSLLLGLVAVWSVGSSFALVIAIWVVLFSVVQIKLYERARKIYSDKRETADQLLSGAVTDTFTNVQTVTLFGSAKREIDGYDKAAKNLLTSALNETRGYTQISSTASLLGIILYILVTVLMFFGWRDGRLTPGDLMFVHAQIFQMLSEAWGFTASIGRVNRGLSSLSQTLGMMKEESKVTDKTDAKTIKVKEGSIDFEDVSFSYKSGSNALRKTSIHLEAGKSYALVGHSGAGKSTIIKLLLRMYDPTSGSIKIDGQDLRDVTLESLRKSIAYVPQDPALFHRSIMDNIRYAKPKAKIEEVIKAAKQAQCHDFVSKLEKGYDTVVGERGAKISGGERQRVAIARAILKDAPILLLDEATSSLDSDSEHEVQKALEAVMKNRTSIIIAHRLSTIRKADAILVVEGGRIVDQGSHEELLARKGIYKDLWDRQSGTIY